MAVPVHAPLPRITYEVVPPALVDTLPRMDVAAFVGYASTGPLHVPVVVDDAVAFRDVFGEDVTLGRDAATGELCHAHLGPAVEEFLRNGGRRCWVVRVAADGATTTRFAVAGLVQASGDPSAWRSVEVSARSPGDWADRLAVQGVLTSERLPAVVTVDGDERRLQIAADVGLVPGDLVRLSTDGGRATVLIAVADTRRVGGRLTIGWDAAVVVTTDFDPADITGAPVLVTPEGHAVLGEEPSVTAAAEPAHLRLQFDTSPPPPLGATLRLPLAGGATLVAVVHDRLSTAPDPAEPDAPTPTGGTADIGPGRVVSDDVASTLGGATTVVAEHLALSLAVFDGERLRARLDGLGFDSRHPAYFQRLPSDTALYTDRLESATGGSARPHRDGPPDVASLWRRADAPRFPLAGDADRSDGIAADAPPRVWFPVGLPEAADPRRAIGAVTDTSDATRRHRAGIDAIGAAIFLDTDLAREGTATLIARAEARSHDRPGPARYRGLHAVLPLSEVTLLAVPDACLPGWEDVEEVPARAPEAPRLAPPRRTTDGLQLWWSAVAEAEGYLVQEADEPTFARPTTRLDGAPPLGPGPEGVGTGVQAPPACSRRRWFRVREHTGEHGGGPWSNTVDVVDPPATFEHCGTVPFAPDLALLTAGDGSRLLRWNPPASAPAGAAVGLAVELERATDPTFARAGHRRTFPDAATGAVAIATGVAAHTFHRARYLDPAPPVVDPVPGPWSVTIVQPAAARTVTQLRRPGRGELLGHLLTVQRAALRLARARGDVLAVLSLPAHYREGETVEHVAWLTGSDLGGGAAGLPHDPLSADDTAVLGHGAIFHPWTSIRAGDRVRAIPPDGAVTGIVAKRTLARGAWISPANQPLAGVVALEHPLDPAAVAAAGPGVNVIARLPSGFVAIAADTMSDDPALRPIEVRRLFALLRRVVLRHGTTYVFEPHGHRFRAMVRRLFEDLLADLYRRGAFAGAVASEAYRVVADDTVNPPGNVDTGRFVVELHVAPTQPMAFLRIRLVQSGPGETLVVEG